MTEAELINGCIENDRRCQNQLYKLYFPFMSKIAIRYYDNVDDAIASINLGFLKLLQSLNKYDSSFKLSTYLGRILINVILNDLKAKTRFSLFFIDDFEDTEFEFALNDSEQKLAYDEVLKLIADLPALHRNVFNLFIIDGYSHKEISGLLSISETHSKWLVFDSRKRLINAIHKLKQSTSSYLKMVL